MSKFPNMGKSTKKNKVWARCGSCGVPNQYSVPIQQVFEDFECKFCSATIRVAVTVESNNVIGDTVINRNKII